MTLHPLLRLLTRPAAPVAVLMLLPAAATPAQINPGLNIRQSLGVNVHFTEARPGEMAMLAAAGFRWVRMDIRWDSTEPRKGAYDFSAYDRLVAAADRYQIHLLLALFATNSLYDHGLSPHTAVGRKAFVRWATAAVRHFAGHRILWEMYNEPNGTFWLPRPDVDAYIKLALAVGEAIREEAPAEAYIGPAALGIDLPFLRACFRAGLLNYWSAVSVHPYRETSPETAAAEFRSLRQLIARYAPSNKQIPILAGEWGYSSVARGMTEQTQGKFAAREWLSDLANDVPLTIWYDWHDDGPDPHDPLEHFGLVANPYEGPRTPVYRPKPAYDAARALDTILGGYRFNKRLAAGGPGDFVLLFTRGQDVRVAAWTTRAAHSIVLPVSSGHFRLTFFDGHPLSSSRAEHRQLSIRVSDAAVYVVPVKPNAALEIAAAWERAPLEIIARPPQKVTISLRLNNPLRHTIRVRRTTGATVTIQPGDSTPLTASREAILRATEPAAWNIPLDLGKLGVFSQTTRIIVQNPLRLVILPVAGQTLPIAVANPSGDPLSGTLKLNHVEGLDALPPALPLKLAPGERALTVRFKLAAGAQTVYQVGLQLTDNSGETVLESPPERFRAIRHLNDLQAGAEPSSNARAVLASELPPEGPPAPGMQVLALAYDLPQAASSVRVAPGAPAERQISGEPQELGLWLYGDGSGNLPFVRFLDATGQLFQAGGTPLAWHEWRYVRVLLGSEDAAHSGGANDGIIHYPIRWDALFMIARSHSAPRAGKVYIAGPTLVYRPPRAPSGEVK